MSLLKVRGVSGVLLLMVLIVVAGSLPLFASDPEEGFTSPFKPSENVMADVEATLKLAQKDGKLALVVMGATWCHDSRSLVTKFADPDIKASLDENYQTVFVDVDYLDTARDVNKRFGMPSIYATPTVMIVDPNDERLTNAKTMHQWRNAANISLEETKTYFDTEAKLARKPEAVSSELAALYDDIDAFERREAARLVAGYDQLGPLMKAYDSGEKSDKMMPLWNEVRGFRFKLTDDLLRLREEARQRVQSGDTSPLEYPSYEILSWEGE